MLDDLTECESALVSTWRKPIGDGRKKIRVCDAVGPNVLRDFFVVFHVFWSYFYMGSCGISKKCIGFLCDGHGISSGILEDFHDVS